jgi:hypothetical protein
MGYTTQEQEFKNNIINLVLTGELSPTEAQPLLTNLQNTVNERDAAQAAADHQLPPVLNKPKENISLPPTYGNTKIGYTIDRIYPDLNAAGRAMVTGIVEYEVAKGNSDSDTATVNQAILDMSDKVLQDMVSIAKATVDRYKDNIMEAGLNELAAAQIIQSQNMSANPSSQKQTVTTASTDNSNIRQDILSQASRSDLYRSPYDYGGTTSNIPSSNPDMSGTAFNTDPTINKAETKEIVPLPNNTNGSGKPNTVQTTTSILSQASRSDLYNSSFDYGGGTTNIPSSNPDLSGGAFEDGSSINIASNTTSNAKKETQSATTPKTQVANKVNSETKKKDVVAQVEQEEKFAEMTQEKIVEINQTLSEMSNISTIGTTVEIPGTGSLGITTLSPFNQQALADAKKLQDINNRVFGDGDVYTQDTVDINNGSVTRNWVVGNGGTSPVMDLSTAAALKAQREKELELQKQTLEWEKNRTLDQIFDTNFNKIDWLNPITPKYNITLPPTKDEPGFMSKVGDFFNRNYSVTKNLATRDDPTALKSIESYISTPVAAAMETVGLLGNYAKKGLTIAGDKAVDWFKAGGDAIGLDKVPGIGNFFKKKTPEQKAEEEKKKHDFQVLSASTRATMDPKEEDKKESEAQEARQVAEQAKYAANVMYFEQYYTGSDVIISFRDRIFTDVVTCQFSYTNNKSPMWGYFSERFDAVSRGTVIVQGQFAVALTDSDKMSTVLGMRVDQDLQVRRTPDRYGFIDLVDRISRDRYDVWVDETGFDMTLAYGDQSPLHSKARAGTKIILNSCHITSHMMYMDANDATPLMMVYTFFGRDENSSAYNEFMNTTPSISDSMYRPHNMDDNLEIKKFSFSIMGLNDDNNKVLDEFQDDKQTSLDSTAKISVLVSHTQKPSTTTTPNGKEKYIIYTYVFQTPAGIAEAQNWINNYVGKLKKTDGSGWQVPKKEILTTIVNSVLHQADPGFKPNNEMVKKRLANVMEVDLNKIIIG